MNKTLASLMAVLLLTVNLPLSSAQAQTAAPMADAEVRRVDKEGARVTLKHGEIKNLDMPPMTMVFQVRDKAMLDTLKSGDRVKFSAEKIEGKYTVTGIEVVK